MATRPSVVIAVLVTACVTTTACADTILHSKARKTSVRIAAPAGWVGPAYDARHDSFGWSHGDDPAACYLAVRFGPYTEEVGDRHSPDDIVVHWNTTPLAKIREQYDREWQNPQVDHIATLRVADQAVRVHAIYNADGHSYIAQILRGDTVISMELRSPSRRELQRHKTAFLTLVRSLRTT